MVDILAARGEEGRGQTTKSSGELLSEHYIRRYPNGATQQHESVVTLS